MRRPSSVSDIFFSFTWLALQGFGGVLAIVQHELVERKRWLSREEFVEEWAVAQLMPGPNVINLALLLGNRFFGLRGALAALAGMVSLPAVLVLLAGVAYAQFGAHPAVAGALRGMGAVAAGLIIGAGLKLFSALGKNPMGWPVCVALGGVAFALVGLGRWPIYAALLGPGLAGCVYAWRRLRP